MTTSVRTRFVFTVATNLLRGAISFSTGVLLARWLEPSAYGALAFVIGTLAAVPQFLDMGTSAAFFTFLSQEPRSRRFVRTFQFWIAVQLIVVLSVIWLLPDQWLLGVWRGEPRTLIMLAFLAIFLQNSAWPVAQQTAESQRRTISVQAFGVAVVVAHLAIVALLQALGMLSAWTIFAALAVEYALVVLVALNNYQYADAVDSPGSSDAPLQIARRFLDYCQPLIPYTWLGFAYSFADVWLLQKYGGGVQQAYYAVAAQFSAVALIATTSILRIFWKEIAEAHHRGDERRTAALYKQVSRLLFLVGSIVTGFSIPWTADLLRLIVGASYLGGATTVAIMFLYPVHQSMGQIGGTMLYATNRVSVTVVTGIVFMLLSMAVTYFVLAPRDSAVPGLGMGSQGLAIKMVVMQGIQVNVVAYLIARLRGWPFDWVYQPLSLLGCIACGFASRAVIVGGVGSLSAAPTTIVMGALLYALFVAGYVYSLPSLTGFTRDEISVYPGEMWRKAIARLKAA